MQSRSSILRIFRGVLTIAACLGATGCDKLGLGDESPTTPSGPPAAGSPVIYAALGASDIAGVGSSVPCLTLFLDCPDGTGYAFVAARQLRSQGFTVTLHSLGIPTAVISRRFQDLGNQYGRAIFGNIIDQLLPLIPDNTTLVTIFAGANDVNVITAALGGGAGGSNQAGFIDQQVRNFRDDYAALVAGVHARAGSARIVLLNLPNLAGMPFLAGVTVQQRQAAQLAAVGMTTTAINPLAAQGATVIDLMCDSRMYLPSTYSADGFHPSDGGYAILASEIVRGATTTSYPAPRSTCAQMTLVP